MRHSLLALTSLLLLTSTAHAESHLSVTDLPQPATLSLSNQSITDYFINSFSMVEDTNDQAAKVVFSLNDHLAISGNVMDSLDRAQRMQNTSVLLTFVVKSNF